MLIEDNSEKDDDSTEDTREDPDSEEKEDTINDNDKEDDEKEFNESKELNEESSEGSENLNPEKEKESEFREKEWIPEEYPEPFQDSWIPEEHPEPFHDDWIPKESPEPFHDVWIPEEHPEPFHDDWIPKESPQNPQEKVIPQENHSKKEDKKPEFVEEYSIDHRLSDKYLFTKDLEVIVKDIEKAEELHAIYSEDILIPTSDTESVKDYYEELMKEEGVMITNDLEFESSKPAEAEKIADHINEIQEESKEIDSDKVKEMDNSESKESTIEINAKKMHLAKDIKFEAKAPEPTEKIQEIQRYENKENNLNEKSGINQKDSKEIDYDRELIYKASSRQATVQALKQETEEISHEAAQSIKEEKYKETEEPFKNKSQEHTQHEEKRVLEEKKEERPNSINDKAKTKVISEKKEESFKNFKTHTESHENIQETDKKEILLKEEWERKLVDWVRESKEKELTSKKKEELIQSIKQYHIARNDYAQIRELCLKGEKREVSEKDKQTLKELSDRFRKRDAKEIEMFKELHRFRQFYEYNKKLWYDSVIELKKEKVPQLLARKLENLKQNDRIYRLSPNNEKVKEKKLGSLKSNYKLLKEKFSKETGKRAIYAGNETNEFKLWKEIQRKEYKNYEKEIIKLQKISDNKKSKKSEPYAIKEVLKVYLKIFTLEEEFILKNLDCLGINRLDLTYDADGHLTHGGVGRTCEFISMRNLLKILDIKDFNVINKINKISGERYITYYKIGYCASILRERANTVNTRKNINFCLVAFNEFLEDCGNDIKFKYLLFETFNKFSTRKNKEGKKSFINFEEIATLIGFSRASDLYAETFSFLLNRLINIHLLRHIDVKPCGISNRNLKVLQKECYKIILFTCIKKGYLKTSHNVEKYSMIFIILLALNYQQDGGKPIKPINKMFTINELSEKVSASKNRKFLTFFILSNSSFSKKNFRNLFYFLEPLKFTEKGKDAFANFIKYFKKWNNKAITYHPNWGALQIIHNKEMLDMTLGLDVLEGIFYKNEKSLGIHRHHLNRFKYNNYIFEFDEQNNYEIVLIPLLIKKHLRLHDYYKRFNNLQSYIFENDLARARITHLFKICWRPYDSKLDYKIILINEFKAETAMVNGKKINIWEDFWKENKVNILEDWINRWVDKKNMPETKWYNNYYQKFFNIYLNQIDDFAKYLLKDSACKRTDFWQWFINIYCRENKHP